MTTDRVKQLRDTADALEVSEWPGYAFTVREVAKELEALLTAKEELEATFDLRWKADMRAIQRWREAAPGRELTLPDHADLCVWLLKERDEQEKHIRLTEAILAVKQQELIAAGLFIIGCGYTGPLTEEAGKQFVSERGQLEKRVEALEAALRETFRMLTESGMQCNHPEEDGECGNIDDCMFHSVLRECDGVIKL